MLKRKVTPKAPVAERLKSLVGRMRELMTLVASRPAGKPGTHSMKPKTATGPSKNIEAKKSGAPVGKGKRKSAKKASSERGSSAKRRASTAKRSSAQGAPEGTQSRSVRSRPSRQSGRDSSPGISESHQQTHTDQQLILPHESAL